MGSDAATARGWRWAIGAIALTVIIATVWRLESATDGVVVDKTRLGATPITLHAPLEGAPAPAVVIAHGFAGSRQLMLPFAVTLARAGYVAISFDFAGHGANEAPLTGDVADERGATQALLAELRRVMAFARSHPRADGRLALLGHSMASDIVVRAAVAAADGGDPDVAATIAVSMFSREVTGARPENLLIIVGAWEDFLGREALEAVALAPAAPPSPEIAEGATYGVIADGTARRAVFADGVEHVGVLYSSESLREAVVWLDATFGNRRAPGAPLFLDARGPWIVALIVAIAALAWPLSALLPRLAAGAAPPISLGARVVLAVTPAAAAPLLLWGAPTDFLDVLVADYLALHFALYGALTLAGLAFLGALDGAATAAMLRRPAFWAALLGVTLFYIGAIGAPLDAYVASFVPNSGRGPLILALLMGAALYTIADAALTHGAPLWLRVLSKLCILASLAAAIALNLAKLFFLAIIFPVVCVFFVLYGVMNRWVARRTGSPLLAGAASAAAFAWALGVTFPLLGA